MIAMHSPRIVAELNPGGREDIDLQVPPPIQSIGMLM